MKLHPVSIRSVLVAWVEHPDRFIDVLHAFERQAKLYSDAANALLRARADAPDLKPPMDDLAFSAAVSAHVQQLEQILAGEQAPWGQLIGEIKPVEPPPKKD